MLGERKKALKIDSGPKTFLYEIKKLRNDNWIISERFIYCITNKHKIFFTPDYTVGFGVSPNPAKNGSWAVPPVGNYTLP